MKKTLVAIKNLFSNTSFESSHESIHDNFRAITFNGFSWIKDESKKHTRKIISNIQENKKRMESLLLLMPICENNGDILFIEENVIFENSRHVRCSIKNKDWDPQITMLVFLINKRNNELMILVKEKNGIYLKASRDFLVRMRYLNPNIELKHENLAIIYSQLRAFL